MCLCPAGQLFLYTHAWKIHTNPILENVQSQWLPQHARQGADSFHRAICLQFRIRPSFRLYLCQQPKGVIDWLTHPNENHEDLHLGRRRQMVLWRLLFSCLEPISLAALIITIASPLTCYAVFGCSISTPCGTGFESLYDGHWHNSKKEGFFPTMSGSTVGWLRYKGRILWHTIQFRSGWNVHQRIFETRRPVFWTLKSIRTLYWICQWTSPHHSKGWFVDDYFHPTGNRRTHFA